MTLTAQSLVNQSLELVSAPTTYARLDALIRDPNSAIDDISDVIHTDPALTTRLLKIVNSPYYGFPSQINTLSRAITIIGTRELTNLVLATTVMNAFHGIPKNLMDMQTFWRHSLACAITARYLAEALALEHSEQYFIAGLLHNIGSLVLYQSAPELARESINRARFGHEVLHEAEQRLLGFHHGDVGAILLQKWRLPESLVVVAQHHHTPSLATTYQLNVALIHVTDVMVSSVPFGHNGDRHVPPLDPNAWTTLALSPEAMPSLLYQVNQQLDTLADLMRTEN
ncbi:HD domain protein [Methylophaga frappieri]|uniref:HD domain protein n=1 Tax=Methylophaga frappieri (strain ATCC BAA-2434 / DSM 25690 / JAM7) TaxID=754477 RepID=I1YHQ7_METFJ|nr:HDOD domain-containing protein [Methylophaga frappieri]AFJ02450.1 HD domain protein [Methylophaga frappieri]